MTETSQKIELLKKHGYHYHFERGLYVNRRARKAFSEEAIDDNDVKWLKDRLTQTNPSGEWRFYFNKAPSDTVRDALLSEIK